MKKRIKQWLSPPVFHGRDDRTRVAKVLYALILSLVATMLLLALVGIPFIYVKKGESAMVLALLLAPLGISAYLTRIGRLRFAGRFLVSSLWLVLMGMVIYSGGIYSPNLPYLVTVTVLTGLVLGRKSAFAIALLSSAVVLLLAGLETVGMSPPRFFPVPPIAAWLNVACSLLVSVIPLTLAMRDLDRAIKVEQDEVRDRKKAEKALRRSEQRFRAIYDSVNDAIFVHDIESGKILVVNQRMLDMYGCSNMPLSGLSIEDISSNEPPYTAKEALAWMRKAVDEGPQVFEWKARRMNGEFFWTEVSMRTAVVDDVKRILVIARDITDRKLVERDHQLLKERFWQAQKMESIGRLAGGVAHDFNNLLTGILGFISLAQTDVRDRPGVHEQLESARKAALSAADLTRQLLAFSRKQIIEPRVLDLNEIVADLRNMLLRVIGEDVRLIVRTASAPLAIRADFNQVEQVIMNMAVNARDAMPSGGELVIETRREQLTEGSVQSIRDAHPGDYGVLIIRDNGTGMSEEVLQCLFEPFFTTKPVGRGTGLGLSMVFGVVKQHQGFIAVDSRVGQGTEFRIYFPLQTEQPGPLRPLQEAESPSGGRGVLAIVEDEPIVRNLAAVILRKGGYRVLEFSSPEEALRTLDQPGPPVDLLLTDMIMPAMNGRELADRLRIRQPDLKVLLCSGYSEDIMETHGPLPPGMGFIGKPFSRDELLAKVKELVG